MKEKESSPALDPFLREAAAALFDAIELPLLSVTAGEMPTAGGEKWVMSVIGFASQQMCGALCVTATRDVTRMLRPEELRGEEASDEALLDAMDEFANMLLGRMKTLLGRRGVAVLLSTPTASIAEKLKISAPPTSGATWYAFRTPFGVVYTRVSVAIEDGVVLDGDCQPGLEPLAEGQMLML